MRFEFTTPRHLLFGAKSMTVIAPAARQMGLKPLLVCGRSLRRAERLMGGLKKLNMKYATLSVSSEPTLDLVRSGVSLAREESCDMVIAFGGGSVIDAGKAIAVLLANSGEPLDYLEIIGRGEKLKGPALPFIAAPTTAGTGSEATINAVLASPADKLKVSLRSPHMMPRLSVVDPDLTIGLPPEQTAFCGLDALAQLIEPYVSKRANLMSDMMCIEGMRNVSRSLLRAYKNGADALAREQMSMAAHLSGMALTNAGLGAVHGVAGPAGGMLNAPHGALCASMLPHVMSENIAALRDKGKEEEALEALHRYEKVAFTLTGKLGATAEEGAEWVGELCQQLGAQPLKNYGLEESMLEELAEKSRKASSMQSNPVLYDQPQMVELLRKAL